MKEITMTFASCFAVAFSLKFVNEHGGPLRVGIRALQHARAAVITSRLCARAAKAEWARMYEICLARVRSER